MSKRKGPYRWKPSRIGHRRCCSRGSGKTGLGSSRPGGPTRRRDEKVQRKPEQETRQRWKRSVAPAASADNTPGTVASPEAGASAARQKRRTWTRVCVPSPGYVVGPKAHRSARGASLVDSAGSQRVRVIVVESLGSRHRTNVSVGACPAARCKARRRDRCLARRKPVPGRKTFLTTRVGGDRAKTVRTFPAVANLGFREETRLEG